MIPSRFIDHRLPPLRWLAQRRSQRIPNQLGAIPSYSFPSCRILPSCLCCQGITRGKLCPGDFNVVLRAQQSNGEVRSPQRKVHGDLLAIPG